MKLTFALIGLAAVGTANALYCEDDYAVELHLSTDAGPAEAVSVTGQLANYVEFKVNQNFFAGTADKVYVQYREEESSFPICTEYTNMANGISTEVLKASCASTQPQGVLDVFVMDSAITGGTGLIPQSCDGQVNDFSENVKKYTYSLKCQPTCSCRETVLDFNDLDDKQYIYDDWYNVPGRGIKFIAKGLEGDRKFTPLPRSDKPVGTPWKERYNYASSSAHNNNGGAVRAFNTLTPNYEQGNDDCPNKWYDGDESLGSPNGKCPAGTPGLRTGRTTGRLGPGNSGGSSPTDSANKGQPGSPYPNCPAEPLGNVIILQEKAYECGDNSYKNGQITLQFNPSVVGAVDFHYVQFLDLQQTITVTIVKADGSSSVSTISSKGRNSLYTHTVAESDVASITFKGRSFSIAEVSYTEGC